MNNSKTLASRATTIGAALILGFSAAAASASTSGSQYVSDGVNKYIVRFPDLDLSKIDGAAVLHARLRHAAGVVCSSLESRNLGINAMYRACMDRAVTNAVASVGSPILSQYHESRAKGEKSTLVQLARAN
jgi:UrcA family protein